MSQSSHCWLKQYRYSNETHAIHFKEVHAGVIMSENLKTISLAW